jgi:hypothetical protein
MTWAPSLARGLNWVSTLAFFLLDADEALLPVPNLADDAGIAEPRATARVRPVGGVDEPAGASAARLARTLRYAPSVPLPTVERATDFRAFAADTRLVRLRLRNEEDSVFVIDAMVRCQAACDSPSNAYQANGRRRRMSVCHFGVLKVLYVR